MPPAQIPTTAPPNTRRAPRRGIGLASERARSSRNCVIEAPAATAARLEFSQTGVETQARHASALRAGAGDARLTGGAAELATAIGIARWAAGPRESGPSGHRSRWAADARRENAGLGTADPADRATRAGRGRAGEGSRRHAGLVLATAVVAAARLALLAAAGATADPVLLAAALRTTLFGCLVATVAVAARLLLAAAPPVTTGLLRAAALPIATLVVLVAAALAALLLTARATARPLRARLLGAAARRPLVVRAAGRRAWAALAAGALLCSTGSAEDDARVFAFPAAQAPRFRRAVLALLTALIAALVVAFRLAPCIAVRRRLALAGVVVFRDATDLVEEIAVRALAEEPAVLLTGVEAGCCPRRRRGASCPDPHDRPSEHAKSASPRHRPRQRAREIVEEVGHRSPGGDGGTARFSQTAVETQAGYYGLGAEDDGGHHVSRPRMNTAGDAGWAGLQPCGVQSSFGPQQRLPMQQVSSFPQR